jgi:hypothetical protein
MTIQGPQSRAVIRCRRDGAARGIRLVLSILSVSFPWILPADVHAGAAKAIELLVCSDAQDRYFDLAESGLDLCDDHTAWTCDTGNQAPENIALTDTTNCPSGNGIRIEAEWSNPGRLEFLAIQSPKFPIIEEHLGFWIRVDSPSGHEHPIRALFRDAYGETFQYTLARPKNSAWMWASVQPGVDEPTGVWGGSAGNSRGVIDGELTLQWICVERPHIGYVGTAVVTVDSLFDGSKSVPSNVVEAFRVPADCVGNLYTEGDRLTLQADFGANPRGVKSVAYEVLDFWSAPRDSGTAAVSSGAADITLDRLPGVGFYTLRLSMMNGEGTVEMYDFPFTVEEGNTATSEFMGMNTESIECYPLMTAAGIGNHRTALDWRLVEWGGAFRWEEGHARAYVEKLVALNAESAAHLNVYGYNNWTYGASYPDTPAYRDAFVTYCTQLIQHVEGNNLTIDYHEIWNEWSIGTGSGVDRTWPSNTPSNYVALLRAASAGIRQTNPDAYIVGIGGEGVFWHVDKTAAMIELGASDHCDAISIHPYRMGWRSPEVDMPTPKPMASDAYSAMAKVDTLLRNYGDQDTGIWVTEFGYPTQKNVLSEILQCNWTLRALAMMRACDRVEKVFLYSSDDAGRDVTNQEHNFGIRHHRDYNFAPKPLARACGVFSRMLDGARFVDRLDAGNADVYIYHFERQGGDEKNVLMAWTTGPGATVAIHMEDAEVIDLMGGRGERSGETSLFVELRHDPLYIVGSGDAPGVERFE